MNNEKSNGNNGYTIKKRRLWLGVLLSFVTLGAYALIWLYLVCRDSDKISCDNSKFKCAKFFWAAFVPYFFGFIGIIASIILFVFEAKILTYTQYVGANQVTTPYFVMNFKYFCLSVSSLCTGFCAWIIGAANIYILLYRIAKKLGGGAFGFIYFSCFLGIWAPALFAQDAVNDYAGDYAAGERPEYLRGFKYRRTV